jgi:RimJ/RimL family protein N-acetyltransferase
VTEVVIEPWTDGDLALLKALNAPEMTEHLGGPETDEQVVKRHKRYVEGDRSGGQMFAIRLLPDREPVGNVGYWEREWQGESVYETGWNVLPAYQGRGIAGQAMRALIDLVKAEGNRRYVHAYPSVHNAASNALCRRLGFTLQTEADFEYPPGHLMRCNDWRYDLTGQEVHSL